MKTIFTERIIIVYFPCVKERFERKQEQSMCNKEIKWSHMDVDQAQEGIVNCDYK